MNTISYIFFSYHTLESLQSFCFKYGYKHVFRLPSFCERKVFFSMNRAQQRKHLVIEWISRRCYSLFPIPNSVNSLSLTAADGSIFVSKYLLYISTAPRHIFWDNSLEKPSWFFANHVVPAVVSVLKCVTNRQFNYCKMFFSMFRG